MQNLIRAVLLIFLLSPITMAQSKQVVPECSEADLKITTLKINLAAERILAEAALARKADIERQLAAQKNQTIAEQEKLVSATKELSLAQQRAVDLESKLMEKEKTIMMLIDEYNHARTWKASFLRVFGVK